MLWPNRERDVSKFEKKLPRPLLATNLLLYPIENNDIYATARARTSGSVSFGRSQRH
jgi:hypothetical protein